MQVCDNIQTSWQKVSDQVTLEPGKNYQIQNVGAWTVILRENAAEPASQAPGIILDRADFIDYSPSDDQLWVRSVNVSTLVFWEKKNA